MKVLSRIVFLFMLVFSQNALFGMNKVVPSIGDLSADEQLKIKFLGHEVHVSQEELESKVYRYGRASRHLRFAQEMLEELRQDCKENVVSLANDALQAKEESKEAEQDVKKGNVEQNSDTEAAGSGNVAPKVTVIHTIEELKKQGKL